MCSPDGARHSPHNPHASPRTVLANWKQPGPLNWKLRRTVVNTWIKIVRRQRCCGNGGEPGC